jgi:hypothetical protein
VSVLQWSPRDPWHLMVGSDDDASPELQVGNTSNSMVVRLPCISAATRRHCDTPQGSSETWCLPCGLPCSAAMQPLPSFAYVVLNRPDSVRGKSPCSCGTCSAALQPLPSCACVAIQPPPNPEIYTLSAALGPAQPAGAQGDAARALGRRAGTLVVPAGRGLPALLRQGQQVRDFHDELPDGNDVLKILQPKGFIHPACMHASP